MAELLPKTVAEVMVRKLVVIDEADTVAQAQELMESAHIRHLPVVRAGVLVGILSDRDLVGPAPMGHDPGSLQLQGRFSKVCIAQVMSQKVITLLPEAPLAEAIALLVEHRLNALPVVDPQGKPVGIFTLFEVAAVLQRLLGAGGAAGSIAEAVEAAGARAA